MNYFLLIHNYYTYMNMNVHMVTRHLVHPANRFRN